MTVELGDGLNGLCALAPGSVRLVLSDLPSGETRAAFDHKPNLVELWHAVWRALPEDGSAVFFASSLRFAAELMASSHGQFRYDLVWSKSVATGFLNAKRRPLRAHEYILVFSLNAALYRPQMLEGATPIHAARRHSHGENYNGMTASNESRAGATDRYPTSVLEYASLGTSARERRHPQQKPVPLLRWLVRSFSEPGDLVVDPFAGSGTTGEAAKLEGRRFRGWDSDARFGTTAVKETESA
jgi:DNA modification methylase